MCNEALLKGHRWRVRRETMYYGFVSMPTTKRAIRLKPDTLFRCRLKAAVPEV